MLPIHKKVVGISVAYLLLLCMIVVWLLLKPKPPRNSLSRRSPMMAVADRSPEAQAERIQLIAKLRDLGVLYKFDGNGFGRSGGILRLTVIPNPVRGIARFELQSATPSTKLIVFDSMGRIVEQLTQQDGAWQWTPGSAVPAGVYFARPETATGSDAAVKFLYLR